MPFHTQLSRHVPRCIHALNASAQRTTVRTGVADNMQRISPAVENVAGKNFLLSIYPTAVLRMSRRNVPAHTHVLCIVLRMYDIMNEPVEARFPQLPGCLVGRCLLWSRRLISSPLSLLVTPTVICRICRDGHGGSRAKKSCCCGVAHA